MDPSHLPCNAQPTPTASSAPATAPQQKIHLLQAHRHKRIGRSMSQSRKKPVPAVVSTGCGSGLMSCLSLHRRAATPPPPPAPQTKPPTRGDDEDDNTAAEQYYWERVQFLEEEIRRLGRKRLAQVDQQEKIMTKTAAAVGSSNDKAACKGQESSSGTTGTTTTKSCVTVGHGADGVQEMEKLEDGSYLHEIGRRVGRPWERLAVQVSQPVVPADAATASEVLDKMTSGKAEDMCKFLAKMMPMKDIAGRRHKQNDGKTVRRKTARLSSGGDFMEAVLFHAMGKLEGLVLEGLKIQMSPATIPTAADRKQDEVPVSKEECSMVVHVVLIQVRDPEEGYGAIGDPMIGLLEASLQRKEDGRVKVEVQGLHVAGIVGFACCHGRGLMWSASLVECKGSRDSDGGGDGRRCSYVRNPNRVFQR